MKSAIVFLALVGYAYGGYVAGLAGPAIGIVNTGSSAQFRSQDNIGNYAFGYNEDHATGGTFRRESGAPGVQVGSYGLRDADGRVRVVNYSPMPPVSELISKLTNPELNQKIPQQFSSTKQPLLSLPPLLLHWLHQ